MSAIFISHSSVDNEFCKRLMAWLETLGHRSLFLDFDASAGFEGGCNWEQKLYRELRVCRALMVVCTEHSMQSKWCFAEITQARSLGKQIFPLRVAPCDVDAVLSDSEIVDFVTLGEKEAFERLKRGLSVAGIDAEDPSDWDGSRPPYPGLLALQEQDAAFFFGRDAEIGQGLDVLNRTHRFGGAGLVVTLGASGSGKSSLVRAGLIPRLKRDPERWLVVRPFRPGEDPFGALADVLAEACRKHATVLPADLSGELSNAGGANSLVDLAQGLRRASGRENASVLLVIDQFEELLGRHPDHPATQFLSCLRATIDVAESSLVFLGTMRSDFLAAFQENAALTGLEFGRILVGPMPVASLTDVIAKPAERAGVRLEPGLVQCLIDDTRTDSALPLLAFTLRELYDKYIEDRLIELHEYKDLLGGLKGALAKAADGALNHPPLSPQAEVEVRNAFLRMARLDDEGHYARQVVRWSDLPISVHPVLRRLVDRRLLVSAGSEGGAGTLEVAHEALFRSWETLTGWLEADREFLLWRRRVAHATREWERAARDHDSLLRGPVLEEAERWLANRPDDIAEAERCFIVAGATLRQRRKIRAVGTGLALVVVLLLGAYEWRSVQQRAELEARFRENVATDVRTSYRTFDTLYRRYGKIRPGVLTDAVLEHGASLFAEGPLAGGFVEAVDGSVELDLIEREHSAFMGSPPTFGAIAYRLEDIAARNDSLRERGRRLRETVREAFIKRQNVTQPTVAEDNSLNRRIQIAAGSFVMGSAEGVGDDDEHPAHRVHLGSFTIQEHEVTNAEYRRLVPTHSFPPGEERRPVVNVTWYAAMAYAAWLGGSLPTEAQWEFAARGPRGREYPWGSEPPTCKRAQFNECAPSGTAEVKSATQGATPEGVYDLAGNVWEWVSDRYGEYGGEEVNDPRGPEVGSPSRVLRGGSFRGPPQFLRGAYRSYPPEGVVLYVGFRVVWTSSGGLQ